MNSFFEVVLDTTPPSVVKFDTSTIVIPGQSLEIDAQFDDDIYQHHSIITDSSGSKHQITLQQVSGRILSGFVDTSLFSDGMAHLELTVYDEVMNEVQLYSDVMIISPSAVYCLHDMIKYTQPIIRDKTAIVKIQINYIKQRYQVLCVKPAVCIDKSNPTLKLIYTSSKVSTRRCHNI